MSILTIYILVQFMIAVCKDIFLCQTHSIFFLGACKLKVIPNEGAVFSFDWKQPCIFTSFKGQNNWVCCCILAGESGGVAEQCCCLHKPASSSKRKGSFTIGDVSLPAATCLRHSQGNADLLRSTHFLPIQIILS